MSQPSPKSEIAAAYNDWAETYDTNPNRTRDLAAQVLRQASLNLAERNVIEVGCGTGRNTEWLARPAAGATDIVALDFSCRDAHAGKKPCARSTRAFRSA